MKKYKIKHRILAMILCISILLTNFSGLTFIDAQAAKTTGTTDHIADTATWDTYTQALNIAENSQNAGRVWADKSVFTGSVNVNGTTVANDSDFLHVFSTIGSSSEIIYQDKIPADVVFVLDFSASMFTGTDRLAKTVEAVNSAINTIVEKSPNSRVGIVVYSSKATTLLPLVNLVPEVGAAQTQWLDSSNVGTGGTSGKVFFSGNVRSALSSNKWSETTPVSYNVTVGQQSSGIGMQTNLQSGISLGMSLLANTQCTTWTSQESKQEYTRIPAVIIMTDGECNLLSQSNDSDPGNAWWNTNADSQFNLYTDEEIDGIAPIVTSTLMTAAYNMTCIYDNYYGDISVDSSNHVYAYGVSVDTNKVPTAQQKIFSILNPNVFFNNDSALHTQKLAGVTYLNDKISVAYDNLSAVINSNVDSFSPGSIIYNKTAQVTDMIDVSMNLADIQNRYSATPKTYTKKQIFDHVNYIDSFYDVGKDEQAEVFDSIVKQVINLNTFKPVGGKNDVNLNNILTYVDPIGKYMQIKDIKLLSLFGKNYPISIDGKPKYFDKYGEEITDEGQINSRSYAYEQQQYKIDADVTEIINPCYSDADSQVLFDLSQIEIYTKTTWDFRDPDIEDGNIRADTGGDQSLYINIPVLALPIQKATIRIDASGNMEDYSTNLNDPAQSTPLRVVYSVGVIDDVKIDPTKPDSAIDLAKLSSDYVAQNRDPSTGKVYLYSNWYNGKKEPYTHYVTGQQQTGYTFGDAVVTFSPNKDNSYYRYQEYLPIYDDKDNTITDIDPEGSYHIITGYYDKDSGYVQSTVSRKGAEFGSGIGGASFGEYLCWYDPDTKDTLPYAAHSTPPQKGYVLAARSGGVSIGDMLPNIGSKSQSDNKTKTSGTYYMPTISDSTSGDVLIVNIYLGNNGSLCVTDTQLLVTKKVSRIGADNEYILNEDFNYTVKLSGAGFKPPVSINAIKVTAAGDNNWRALIKSIELLTNNQGLLLKEGGTLATYTYAGKEYYIFVGGDSEEECFTHTVFEKTDSSSLDKLLGGKDAASLNVQAYLLPIDSYDSNWFFYSSDPSLKYIKNFEIGDIDTTRPIGYEIDIPKYQSSTIYEYDQLEFDRNGVASFTLKDGEGILLLGLEDETQYTVTEKMTKEQAEDKGILLQSVEHITEGKTRLVHSGEGALSGDDYEFDTAAHTYTVHGTTGTDNRREANYCNYVPKVTKELIDCKDGFVNVGDTIAYVLYWENYCPDGNGGYKTAKVTVVDELDPGVDFKGAEFVTAKTVTENGKATLVYEPIEIDPQSKWEWSYNKTSHTVTWTMPDVPGGQHGYVRLIVTVNENALKKPGQDNVYDYEISNQGEVQLDNKYTVKTNIVTTPVTDVHKTETKVVHADGTVQSDEDGSLKLEIDEVTGNYVGPKVESGSQITYKITFANYQEPEYDEHGDPIPSTIVIKDKLDPDVAFVSAMYGGTKLDVNQNPDQNGKVQSVADYTGEQVTITYYSSRTVEWKITGVPSNYAGEKCVYLTVYVTADDPKSGLDEDDGSGGDQGGDSGNTGKPTEKEKPFLFPDGNYTLNKINDAGMSILPEGVYVFATTSYGNSYAVSNAQYATSSTTYSGALNPSTITITNDRITSSDKNLIWIVEYPTDANGNKIQNPLYFYVRSAANGKYLYSDGGTNYASSELTLKDKSSASQWVLGTRIYGTSTYRFLSLYNANNAQGISYYFYYFNYNSNPTNTTQFFRTDMPNIPEVPEAPNEFTDPPQEPAADEPEPDGIEGDYKIINTASVKVNKDPKRSTETVENPMAGELVIEKQLCGKTLSSDKNKEFEFTVTLTPDASAEKFDPSTLSVIKTGENGQTPVKIQWTRQELRQGVYSGVGSFTIKSGEAIHIAGFVSEVSYKVQEKAEENYDLDHVTINGSSATVTERAVNGKVTPEDATTKVVFYNASNRIELPDTGGIGTTPFLLLGGVLVTLALLWLMLSKKKSRHADK